MRRCRMRLPIPRPRDSGRTSRSGVHFSPLLIGDRFEARSRQPSLLTPCWRSISGRTGCSDRPDRSRTRTRGKGGAAGATARSATPFLQHFQTHHVESAGSLAVKTCADLQDGRPNRGTIFPWRHVGPVSCVNSCLTGELPAGFVFERFSCVRDDGRRWRFALTLDLRRPVLKLGWYTIHRLEARSFRLRITA